jgi:predicted TIM-barrel fold metal-dependent hydrolase
MLDGRPLIDAHQHPVRLPTVKPAWLDWAERHGQPGWRDAYSGDGAIIPQALDDLMRAEGVDHALVICEYSPKATGMQPAEDLLPLIRHNPARFSLIANVNPHLHYPPGGELARQLALGAIALKVHPVHGGFSPADPALYPAYQACAEQGRPVVVHCGTSTFPGSSNELADPALLIPVLRDFPGLTVVLAHGGRGWWYDAAASLALLHENVWIELSGLPPASLALLHENVWIELSGLPPHRLPHYYARFDLARLARKFIFGTDWPGVPGIARNARALAGLGLDEDVLAGMLAGHAMKVYPGLTNVLQSLDAASS